MKPVLALRHVPHETLGNLEQARRGRAGLQYVDQYRGDARRASIRLGGRRLVVLGGPMNVYETEKYPFLAREVDWIRQAKLSPNCRCWASAGSQLLARPWVRRFAPNRVKREIGSGTMSN